MAKIFWFRPRDKKTGQLREDFIECDERVASEYIKKPMELVYVGWSDGVSFTTLKFKLVKDSQTGMALDISEEQKQALRDARLAEIEKAKMSDKTLPRDFSKMNLNGGLMEDRFKRFTNG